METALLRCSKSLMLMFSEVEGWGWGRIGIAEDITWTPPWL